MEVGGAGMALERKGAPLCGRVRKPHGPIVRARGTELAVRREGDA
jgi:hypothetical protein